ncbi:MAG: histidine phosphotransferase ChpT [Caulobacteraceae bacterium]
MTDALAASPAPENTETSQLALAARLAAKLCHDFISPASALISGLDLLDDPEQADLREEAMSLIASSARKLEDLLTFYRVTFGGSQATESFDARDLEKLARGRVAHTRTQLDWDVTPASLDKAPARILLNLVELAVAALPVGGQARIEVRETPDTVELSLRCEHARANLHADTLKGLRGEDQGEAMGGRWVQPFFLQALVAEAGGTLRFSTDEGLVAVAVSLPAGE